MAEANYNPSNPNVTFKMDEVKANRDSVTVLDREWLKNSFFISDKSFMGNGADPYKESMMNQRYHTSADYKFTATSIGMNIAMNPKPQYTPYADIRSKGRLPLVRTSVSPSNILGEYGMGAYYSEAIDDTAERIYLRFGVPQFNSLFNFANSAYDPWMATMMSKGRIPGEIEKLVTEAVGVAISLATIMFIWTKAPTFAKAVIGINGVLYLLDGQSRFYNFKPTMHSYWLFVDAIVNSLVNKRGLAPFVELHKDSEQMKAYLENRPGSPQTFTADAIAALHNSMPDFIGKEGRINLFSVVLRSQRIFNFIQEYEENYQELYDNGGSNDIQSKDAIEAEATIFQDAYNAEKIWALDDEKFMRTYLGSGNPYVKAKTTVAPGTQGSTAAEPSLQVQNADDPEAYLVVPKKTDQSNPSEADKLAASTNVIEGAPKPEFANIYNKVKGFFKAELTDGLGFVCLNVESTGSMSESFSSQTKQIPLHTTIQGAAAGARDLIYNVAGGSTGVKLIDDAISLVIGAVSQGVSTFTGGLADPLLAAMSGHNIEMPKMYDSSDARLSPVTYRIRLMSPYGNAFSQIQNIYIPLAMLLAGSLPRAVGNQTHTAPFLCQVFNRGRMQTSLGIISSLSVSRGVSNLPFNRHGQAMAIDVDFTIEDLSSVMFMNVMQGGLLSMLKDIISLSKSASLEDNAFSDYLNIIAGVDVYNQIYWIPRARLRIGELFMRLKRVQDPAYLSSMIFNLPIVNTITSIGQAFNQKDHKSF